MKQLCGSLIVGILIGASAITALSQSRETQPRARAIVSFNNRPSIQWELTEAETVALIEMLATLKSRVSETEHDHLGFRGLDVIIRDSELLKSEDIEICDGIVRRVEAKRTCWYEDKGRQIERWLLEAAKERFGPGVYDGVKIQVESSRQQ